VPVRSAIRARQEAGRGLTDTGPPYDGGMADGSDKRGGRSSGRRSERQGGRKGNRKETGSRKTTADRPTAGTKPSREQGWPRWGIWLILGLIASALFLPNLFPADELDEVTYDRFLSRVAAHEVSDVLVDNLTGRIEFTDADGVLHVTAGPLELSIDDRRLLAESGAAVLFETPQPGFLQTWLPPLLFVGMIILFFWWMSRRAQGQMGGMMSIGRSRAKTYSSERPGTTFDDVAGYEGVKMEIREVVDFLKDTEKFSEIGARVPKGVLLVGPPGTGKTLIARAVAGEAGVPFLSVTGSDFMEMFVGVGASRVRDLFETARKMGRAIIFIDEVDSIGRKRGAGLGGGSELAMLCDMIVAGETAKFGQPEINLGIIPGAGGTQRLTRAVGKAIAMEMVLNDRKLSAEEALAYGLVNRVVPAERYLDEAINLAQEIAARAPVAVQIGKEAVNQAFETSLTEGVYVERRLFNFLFATEDQSEGMAAFIEKRKANWQGQ